MTNRFKTKPELASERELAWVRDWLSQKVLPHWWAAARDKDMGGFYEALDFSGAPLAGLNRRGRVTPRQLYAFALARRYGLFCADDFEPAMRKGCAYLLDVVRGKGGELAGLIGPCGRRVLAPAVLYDLAFMALAGSELSKIGIDRAQELTDAAFAAIDAQFKDRQAGGYWAAQTSREKLANPHMHLLEAAICQFDASAGQRGAGRMSEIIRVFESHFYNAERHIVHEQRGGDFSAQSTDWVEPGHGLEWAFLYQEAAHRLSAKPANNTIAASLLSAAEAATVETAGHALIPDKIDETGVTRTFRLWPQLERLRTVYTLGPARDLAPILSSLRMLYLSRGPETGWVDAVDASGEPSAPHIPASMIYHLMTAFGPLLVGET